MDKEKGVHQHIVRNLPVLLRHRRLAPVHLKHLLVGEGLDEGRARLRLRKLGVQPREVGRVGVPRRHVHPGRADRVRVDVLALVALLVGEEPEGGHRDELRRVHVRNVGHEWVVLRKGRDELAAFGLGAVVDGVDEDVRLCISLSTPTSREDGNLEGKRDGWRGW